MEEISRFCKASSLDFETINWSVCWIVASAGFHAMICVFCFNLPGSSKWLKGYVQQVSSSMAFSSKQVKAHAKESIQRSLLQKLDVLANFQTASDFLFYRSPYPRLRITRLSASFYYTSHNLPRVNFYQFLVFCDRVGDITGKTLVPSLSFVSLTSFSYL